ncbi:MAG: FAD-binding oxidoreductase [Actinobacteria bacterium]|nr:MAG: FAD-binding oxidoreductase [Actinomycetota bacterium]
MDRRGFLRRAGGLILASPPLAALVGACTRATSTSTPTTSAPPTTPTTSVPPGIPWDDLAAGLHGRLIRPGTPSYPGARLAYDPRFDDIRPRAIVMANTAGDVARTILFARDHSLAFAARCGGHSYGGYSLSDGIVIDSSEMATIRTGAGTAMIGAGAKVIDVAAGLAAAGAVIPVGTCATVGISGLTLGGGQGIVGRRFGLTCDSLRAATVVLADGRIVTCDASTDADLFWALRGAGGGNLGVVTSFTFVSHPLNAITAFSMSWPWSDAADVVAAWQTWGPSVPAPLWSSCRLRWIPGSGPSVSVSGAWSSAASELARHLDELASASRHAPSRSTVTMSPLDAARYFAGCSSYSIEDCRLTEQGGRLTREGSLAKSDFFDRSIDADVVRAALALIEGRGATTALAAQTAGVLFDAWGGTITDVAPDGTAFPHRGARFLGQEFVTFHGPITDATLGTNRGWLTNLWRAFRPAASGAAYVNYIDPELRDWLRAYYGDNLARLVDVKRRYDPDDAFRFAQSIPTTLPS